MITDLTNPTSTITSVNGLTTTGGYTSNNTLRINFSATDTNIKNWTLSVYNSTPVLVATWNDSIANTSQALSYAAVINGSYQVNLTVIDNSTRSTITSFTVYVDQTLPVLSLLTPTDSYYNNSATPVFAFKFNDTLSLNASCTLYLNGTAQLTNSTVQNNTDTNINTTLSLGEGIRTWYVNCTDPVSNLGQSPVYTLITDLTNPAGGIAWVNDLTTSGDGTTNNTLRINFTMSDTNLKNWTLRVYNSTPALVATWNDTVNNNSQVLSYAAVSNGTYYINLTTWDNSSRTNTSTVFTVYMDQINPVLVPTNVSGYSTTGVTLTTSASDSISAVDFCNYSGAGSGNFTLVSGQYTANLSGLVANTEYTATIRCYDLAGNLNSTTAGFRTWATSSSSTSSSSGGGGAGGAAAGVPTSVAGQFEQKTWTSINKGETATVEAAKDGMTVTKVEFKVNENVYGAWVKVSRIEKTDLPSSTPAFANKAYQYIEVKKNEVAFKEGSISDAKLNVKVEKAWLNSNKVDKFNVALFRYAGGKWNELTTSFAKEDEKYVYYSAPTPGFSYFVVGQKTAAVTAPATTTTPPVKAEPAVTTPGLIEEAPAVVPEKTSTWPWVVGIIILLVIVVWIALTWKKGQEKKK